MFFGIIVCLLSGCIFLIGLAEEFYAELGVILQNLGIMFSDIWLSEPLLVVEYVIYEILSIPASFLVFYFIMSIAQLFTVKNRKVIAVLMFLGSAFVLSLLNTTLISPMLDAITNNVSIHLTMWIQIIVIAAVNVGCYLFVRYVLRNKVNLIA